MHKYHAKPTMVHDVWFASQKEARRYQELCLLGKLGALWDLEIQPRFELHVASVRVGQYRGDFAYQDQRGRVVEDVKGFKTPVYRLKKKMVEAQYGITIVEI